MVFKFHIFIIIEFQAIYFNYINNFNIKLHTHYIVNYFTQNYRY